jgi:hypothetical protein
MKPLSGTVKLMGKKPGDRSVNIPGIGVGFMPQVSHLIIVQKNTSLT